MTNRNYMENTGYSWDAYKRVVAETDRDFGKGAYDSLRTHLIQNGKSFQDFNDVLLDDIIQGKTDDEYTDTYRFHQNVINSNEGRAFLNQFAGRDPDSTTGFYNDKTVSSGSTTKAPKRASIFTSKPTFATGSSKRRGNLFSSMFNSLFGN